jgi:hypothetical protein
MMRLLLVALLTACQPQRPTHTEIVHDPPKKKGWCVDETNCGPGFGHCMDICYKYNHPNGPKHDACNKACRETYCGHVEC